MLSIGILSIVIGNAVAVMLSITAPARKVIENHTIFHSLDTVRLLLKDHSKIFVRHFVTKFQQVLLFSEFDKLQQHSKYFYQITKRVNQEVLLQQLTEAAYRSSLQKQLTEAAYRSSLQK